MNTKQQHNSNKKLNSQRTASEMNHHPWHSTEEGGNMYNKEAETLLDIVIPSLRRFSDRSAVQFDDGDTVAVVTYTQLQESALKIAAVLKRYNVTREIIGICLPPSQHLPAVLIGVLWSGAAFYNFDPSSVHFAKHVIEKMGIRFILTDRRYLQKLKIVDWEENADTTNDMELQIVDVVLVRIKHQDCYKHREDLAYCITTSGTTGTPKIVRVPHTCIVPNIIHLRKIFEISDVDLVFLSSPLTFDPSIVDIFLALGCGACLLIVPQVVKMMPRSLLKMLYYRHTVTYLQATPSLISTITAQNLYSTILGNSSKLRILAFGGEKFPSLSLLRKWRAPDNKTEFYNLYGTTEVSCWSTCYKLTDADFRDQPDSVPLGLPLMDTVVKVLDDKGQEIKEGTGQVYIGGVKKRQCYLDSDEGDSEIPKLRATGDRVSISCGNITFLHRLDDQVKRNGQRINLCEIEKVLLKHEDVSNCQVVFEKGKLAAFVLPKDGEKITAVNVLAWFQKHLPSHYWPDHVVMVTKFPITKHGKLNKEALLEMVGKNQYSPENCAKPVNVPAVVENIWKDVLMAPDVVLLQESKFLFSGGDSILAVRLVNKVEKALNLQLPELLDMVLHQSYGDILYYIETCFAESMPQSYLPLFCQPATIDKNFITSTKPTDTETRNALSLNTIVGSKVFKTHTGNTGVEDNTKTLSKIFSEFEDGKNDIFIAAKKVPHISRKRKYNCTYPDLTGYTDTHNMTENLKEQNLNRYEIECDHCTINTDHLLWSFGRGNSRHYCQGSEESGQLHCNRTDNTQNLSYQHSQQADKYDDMNKEFNRKLRLTMNILWKVNTGKCVDASPTVAKNRDGGHIVYIGSHSHKFFAISIETGKLLWETVLGDRIESSACISHCGHYVIVGCYDGAVYVFCQLTGEVWWKYQTGAEVKSSPVIDPQTSLVYVGSHDKHIHALNIKTKSVLFKTYLEGGSVFSSPCLRAEPHVLCVGTLSGVLAAINPSNGDIIWTFDCGKPLFSSPCLTPEGICVGCVDNCLYHIDIKGNEIWHHKTKAPVFSSPVYHHYSCNNQELQMAEGKIMFGSHDHCVYCLSNQGVSLWKILLDSPVYSTPFCFDLSFDSVYLTGGCCKVHHDTEDGHITDSSGGSCDVNIDSGSAQNYCCKTDTSGFDKKKSECHFETMIHHYFLSDNSEQSKTKLEKNNCVKTEVTSGKPQVEDSTQTQCQSMHRKTCAFGFVPKYQDIKTQDPVDKSLTEDEITHQKHVSHSLDNTDCIHDNDSHCRLITSPQIPLGRIPLCVVATTRGTVYVLDRDKGEVMSMINMPGEVFSSPVVCGQYIVVGCRDDFVYCLKISTDICSVYAENG